MTLLFAVFACGTPELAVATDPHAPELQDIALTVGEPPDQVQMTLASAWMDPGNTGGHGLQARAELPGPPPLVITGERSAWDLATGVVIFEGDVVATRGDVTLTCARLEVTYAGEKVDVARASGGVRVGKGARQAVGATAVLTVADGKVVIEGSPAIRDGANAMTGERITLYLDDERLECDACRLEVAGDAVTAPR